MLALQRLEPREMPAVVPGGTGTMAKAGSFTLSNLTVSITGNSATAQSAVNVGAGGLTLDAATVNVGAGATGAARDGKPTVAGDTMSAINLTAAGFPGRLDFGTGAHAVNVAAGTTLTVSATVLGNGTLSKPGTGTRVLSGATATTFSGTTTVNAGTVQLNKPAGDNAIAGDLYDETVANIPMTRGTLTTAAAPAAAPSPSPTRSTPRAGPGRTCGSSTTTPGVRPLGPSSTRPSASRAATSGPRSGT